MGSLIHELDNDALLMMYLADELSDEDRADVEQLLGVDAGLRAGLITVRDNSDAAARVLIVADKVDPAGGLTLSGEAVAIRRAGRAFRQFQVDQLARNRPTVVVEPQPAFPRWAYPIGAVAAALLVAVGWWGWERRSASRARSDPYNQYYADRGFYGGGFGGGMSGMRIVGDAFGADGGSTPGLFDAEVEVGELHRGRESADLPALFGDAAEN